MLHSRTLQPVADGRQRLTLRCRQARTRGCTHFCAARLLRRCPHRLLGGSDRPHRAQGAAPDRTLSRRWRPSRPIWPAIASIRSPCSASRIGGSCVWPATLEVAEGAFEVLRDFQLQGSFTGLIQKGRVQPGGPGGGRRHRQRRGSATASTSCWRISLWSSSGGQRRPEPGGRAAPDRAGAAAHRPAQRPVQPSHPGPDWWCSAKGNIGGHWLGLYAREKARLEHELNLALTLYGVFGSEGGLLDEEGWDPLKVQDNFNPKTADLAGAALPAGAARFDALIALDLTASETVSRYYPDFAQLGIPIIAANKFAGAADSEFYQRIKQTCRDHQVQWRYNATVGAGPAHPVQHPDVAPERRSHPGGLRHLLRYPLLAVPAV